MDAAPERALGEEIADGLGVVVSATLVFRTSERARFARFPGSAWRGAFGHSLKRLVCVMHLRPCEGCGLRSVCVFPRIFAPAVPPDAPLLTRYRSAPSAFVLDPAETPARGFYAAGEAIALTLRLFGSTAPLAPYALRALLDAAAGGVGPDRVRLTPERIRRGLPFSDPSPDQRFTREGAAASLAPSRWALPPPPRTPVMLRLTTPLRLRLRNDLITPEHFLPAHLLGAALRRVSFLASFFGTGALILDYRALTRAAQALEWGEGAFRWIETTRHSTRQNSTMQMGGIIGEAWLDLRSAPDLWPFLWLGQWLHVGKSPTMGFGRYRIATPEP